MSSSSYSALLRRSKLASYNPSIEQVYTSTGGNLSRSNFGLKRPLPQATTSAAPFVRVNSLDNAQKRTEFRKGTKEALYVQKWAESGHRVTSSADRTQGATPDLLRVKVQSRFVPEAFGGAVPKPAEALKAATALNGLPPNFLDFTEQQFDSWLASLTDRRHEFAQFLQKQTADRSGIAVEDAEPTNLYAHAQSAGKDLVAALQQFLAATTDNPLHSNELIAHPHRTLGLQYSTITPLEASLAAPVPGRILGARSDRNDRGNTGSLASVLGQVGAVQSSASAGAPATTWFADASGQRSNIPGQAMFIPSAVVKVPAYATNAALAASRGLKPFQPRNAGVEASAFAERVVSLGLEVSSGPHRAAVGSRAYSGDLPQSRKPAMDPFEGLFDLSRRAGKGEPRQIGGTRLPYEQQLRRRNTTQRLRQGQQKAAGPKEVKAEKNASILSALQDLLN